MVAIEGIPMNVAKAMTAEEFRDSPDDDRRTELVKGMVIEYPRRGFRVGATCGKVSQRIGNYVDEHELGWVLSNNSGVITTRDPDSVRGPDVAYFSYKRIPKDEMPAGYPAVTPELVFEVLSPSDRPSKTTAKVGEYLEAGVLAVCVLDPERRVLVVHPHGGLARRYEADDELVLPEVFPDFRIQVSKLID